MMQPKATMKIKPEHYDSLRAKIIEFLVKHPDTDLNACLNSMRSRWQLYWNCGGAFTNAQEYQYLKDDHIDTALKAIIHEQIAVDKKLLAFQNDFQDRLNADCRI